MIDRRTFLAGASLMAVARNGDAKATATNSRWPMVAPPETHRIDHWIEQLGRRRDDPYAWLKFVPATGTRDRNNLPEPILQHLDAEAAYSKAILAPLGEARDGYLKAMLGRTGSNSEPPPLTDGPWRYTVRMPAGASNPVYVRIDGAGHEQILLDEAARARGHAYYRSTDHQPSPDHRYYAWAEDVVGNDRHQICVLDTVSGTIATIAPADAYGYGGLAFAPSSRRIFWIWRDSHNRPTRLYRSDVRGGQPTLVYEENDPALFMQVARTAAGGFVALRLAGPDIAEVRLISRSAENDAPRVVIPRKPGVTYDVEEWNGALLLSTDADGAIDRKLLALDPVTFARTGEVLPTEEGRPILAVAPFRRALVVLIRKDGLHAIIVCDPHGKQRTITFDDAAYALELIPGQSYEADGVRIVHQTPASPPRWIEVDLVTGAQTQVGEEHLRDYDPANYTVEQIEIRADDGEMVPVTILSRRHQSKDGHGALLLYGYGAYGISSDPVFSLPATVLVDRGWRYAIAHVRGGSEKGQRWFLEGRRFSKRNSMTDFVACAKGLAARGYADPDRLVAYGLSAGGLLVGGAMNIAPRLWAGVIAQVPFVDMLNTMSDASHPLVPLFRPDWGDPLADPKAYDYIASISPYENVRRAPYPPLLTTAGLKDDRVSYWEPAKLVANVRRLSTSSNPAILDVDMDAGHQSSADQRSVFGKMATFWAFADRCAAVGAQST